jgi:hypothetical protein
MALMKENNEKLVPSGSDVRELFPNDHLAPESRKKMMKDMWARILKETIPEEDFQPNPSPVQVAPIDSLTKPEENERKR